MDEKNSITFRGDGVTVPLDVKPVSYQGKTIECNFFETFGRLTRKQIETWLTGVYDISNVYDAFSDEDNWRSRYWEAFETKTYRKLKAWEHENEYRLVLTNQVYRFNDSKNRNLQYDPQMLKGLIFGINTSEYDKKRLMEKLNKYANELEEFAFYQAEYDDEAQSIRVRKKVRWEI